MYNLFLAMLISFGGPAHTVTYNGEFDDLAACEAAAKNTIARQAGSLSNHAIWNCEPKGSKK